MNFGSIISVVLSLIGKREEIVELVQDIMKLISRIQAMAPGIIPKLSELGNILETPEAEYSVEWLQESLNQLVDADLDVDGDYGASTKEAVKKFQRKYKLEVDGWAGIETQAAIVDALK